MKSTVWPNEANLQIAKLWLTSVEWSGQRYLDSKQAPRINSYLEAEKRASAHPHRLHANEDCAFIGTYLWGSGFAISHEEAAELLGKEPRAADVLFRYPNGRDVNEHPAQAASRHVINFREWPLDRAQEYAECFRIVQERVWPERSQVTRERNRERWWIFGETRPGLYRAISALDRVLVVASTSRTVAPVFVDADQVLDKGLVVFAYEDDAHFGVLSSATHYWWVLRYGPTMRTDLRYMPSDVFETFPQPMPQSGPGWEHIDAVGRQLNKFRADFMIRTDLGLTKTYNRLHDPNEHDPDIERLRALHVQLDYAVRDAYGWTDLQLDHHHWETPQCMRFTVSPSAKDELLDRLLELNHQRYAEEVAAGLHDNKAGKSPRRGKPTAQQQNVLL